MGVIIIKFKLYIWIFFFIFGIGIAGGGLAKASIEYIYPIDDINLGLTYRYISDDFVGPYASMVYNFTDSQFYYRVGSDFLYNNLLIDINFGYWFKDTLPGYSYGKGFEGSLRRSSSFKDGYRFSLFNGKLGSFNDQELEATYLNFLL